MKKKNFNLLINTTIIAFIVITAFVLFGNNNQQTVNTETGTVPTGISGAEATDASELAQCLTEKGAVMYGAEWCGHCRNQKAMFGDSVKDINFVDCDKNKEECVNNGVRGYPTWKINGQLYSGERPLPSLKQISGC